MRQIAISKFPGLGLDGINRDGQGTGGSLANRGLKVTVNSPRPPPKELGMPSAVSCCETSDGRLAILFSDAHVRILEIREDKLAVQEALFTKLTGQNNGGPQQGMRGASMDDIDDFDDAFEDSEDDSSDNDEDWENRTDEALHDKSRNDGLKTQRGSSRSKGKGRGRGRGGKGKGSHGRGVGRSGNAKRRKRLSQLAKEGAANVLRKARNMAKQASDSSEWN